MEKDSPWCTVITHLRQLSQNPHFITNTSAFLQSTQAKELDDMAEDNLT
jgi:hypothetical protein